MAKFNERYYYNPFLSDPLCKQTEKSEKAEAVETVLGGLRPRVLSAIEAEIPAVLAEHTSNTRDQSVYTGVAGAVLLYIHLATTIYRNDKSRSKSELLNAQKLLAPVLQSLKCHRYTFLCGGAGPLAVGAVLHSLLGQETVVQDLLKCLKDMFVGHKSEFQAAPSELLYGHVGYLYSLLYVNSYILGAVEDEIINEVALMILSIGKENASPRDPSPLMHSWHDKRYLGAAHGLAGIMTVLMQVTTSSVGSHLHDLIKPCVDYILSLQFPSGNFPSSLESKDRDRLIHWCHGAPGCVHMLATAYRLFGEARYLQAAEHCGNVVWERGILTKGYGLCHGVAGNGYVFLQLYRLTGHPHHLHRAIKFAEWCMTSSERQCLVSDSPFSLFGGVAGKLYFLADICCNPLEARFPALELPYVHSSLSVVDINPTCSKVV